MARPVDQNGDYKIDANNDRTIVGHYDPRWTLGLNTNFTYKGWDLGIQLYGRMGFKYYDSSVWVGGRYNVRDYDYYNENNKMQLILNLFTMKAEKMRTTTKLI